ncbi:polyprenyl synthetase family protein [Streptomyces sp. NPDC002886]|uniref:polyprenyl synthetase family protein n=1 Tax=Streptomyces sp. NPDC002886 TaxID=3364667 RepID=UPI0036D080F8
MVRPALVLACCRAVGGDKMQGLPAAVAVELIHNASLLHDDIIDHDATRRGRPTLWAQLGLPAAILAGDALFFLAIDVLTDAGGPLAVGGINSLTAATQKLIGGEYTDVLLEEQTSAPLSVVEAMAQAKTGELIAEACALGALAGGASPATISLLKRFGVHLGAAFQLVDDILGIWGDPLQTGKPGYSDLRARKKSLPVAAALNAGGPAAARLGELYARAEPFSEEELTLVAGLVDQANGRAWAEKTAASHIRAARRHLVAACPSPGAAEDLNVLARMITHRDR